MLIRTMGVNGRGLTGDVTFELAGNDRKRCCMFSINLILSVHTYALLTKLVPSRWLGVGQLFQHFYGPRWELGRWKIIIINKRRTRPIYKRVICFPCSNNGVFTAREFNHMENNPMYYRIQMFKEPRFADLTAEQLVVGCNYRSFQLGFSRLTNFGAPLRLFRLSSVFRFGLEFFFFNIINQYHKSSFFDMITGFKLFTMI